MDKGLSIKTVQNINYGSKTGPVLLKTVTKVFTQKKILNPQSFPRFICHKFQYLPSLSSQLDIVLVPSFPADQILLRSIPQEEIFIKNNFLPSSKQSKTDLAPVVFKNFFPNSSSEHSQCRTEKNRTINKRKVVQT